MKRGVNALNPLSTVVLTVPELGALRARVLSVLEDQIVLSSLHRPTTPLLLLRYDATLRSAGARDDEVGVVGTLSRRGDNWFFEPSRDQWLQRREAVRVEAAVSVQLSTATGPVPDAKTVDLSARGALIRLPTAPEVASAIELKLHLPDGRPPLCVGGHIVRVLDHDLVGVRFDTLVGVDERRLGRFLFARQWAVSRDFALADGRTGPRPPVAS
jgi:hypothetical protein